MGRDRTEENTSAAAEEQTRTPLLQTVSSTSLEAPAESVREVENVVEAEHNLDPITQPEVSSFSQIKCLFLKTTSIIYFPLYYYPEIICK